MSVVITTAPSVAAATAAASAVASANSSKDMDLKCEVLMSDFSEIEKPNVKEMQEFSQCVERIHPTHEAEQNKKDFAQVGIIFSLIVFIVGFSWSRWFKSNDFYHDTHGDFLIGTRCVVVSWFLFVVGSIFYWAFS